MIEAIVLGIVQGVTEWLPISSEGIIVLLKTRVFGAQEGLREAIEEALFLHMGTFFAALVYFRRDIKGIFITLFDYSNARFEEKSLVRFLVIATLVSGTLGFLLLQGITYIEEHIIVSTRFITALIGLLLLGTGWMQLKAKTAKTRDAQTLSLSDGLILGIAQGFSALPGFSRSGLTVAALLLRKVEESEALRISFLMSLPIVLGANIALSIDTPILTKESIAGLFFSFIFGILTIDWLLRLARKIKFGTFVLVFGVLTFIAAVM